MSELNIDSWVRIPRTRRAYLERTVRKQFGDVLVFILQGPEHLGFLPPELRCLDGGDWYGVVVGIDWVVQ